MKNINLFLLFISQMNGQKIDSLTIDKSCLTKVYCTNSSNWWYLFIKLSSNNTIQENLIPFLETVLVLA
jgi:hypothetical protein